MASSRSSRLRFLSSTGEVLGAPPEWQPCFVEILGAQGDLEDLGLTMNGKPLAVSRRKVGDLFLTVGEWTVQGAGGYSLELTVCGDIADKATCQIAPEKLSQAGYEALISDLQDRLPATVAIALQQAGALSGIRIVAPRESTLAEEMHRLRRACDGVPGPEGPGRHGLIRVLEELARGPHQVLANIEAWTPRYRARRISSASLYRAFAKPMNLDEHNRPLVVPEHRVEHVVDTYENRLVRGFHDQVTGRLRAVRDAKDAGAATKYEARELLHRLGRARHSAKFLDEVSELSEPPTRLTMVLLKRPEYRAALEGFLEFRRTVLVQLDEPRLQAPLTNLPQLYETWGTLKVIQALLEVGQSLHYQVDQAITRRSEGRLWLRVLTDGAAAVRLDHPDTGMRASLIPQRTYSASTKASGLRSVSFKKRPDIAIEIRRPDGSTEVWIFDPKYKLVSATAQADPDEPDEISNEMWHPGLPKRVDLDAMHAYRDAIRSSSGERVVRYAATLYPGETKVYDDGLAAVRADPADPASLDAELRAILLRALDPAGAHSPLIDSG